MRRTLLRFGPTRRRSNGPRPNRRLHRPNRRSESKPDRGEPVAERRARAAAGARTPRIRRFAARAGRIGLRSAIACGAAWGLLLGVEQGYDYATTSPRFEVRSLIYQPTEHLDDDRLRELMGLSPGSNILSLDLDRLAEAIAADPWVARASVVRELPDALIVEVEEHEAAAMLLAGALYLVDADGRPFKRLQRTDRDDLPIITGVSASMPLTEPAQAQQRIQKGLKILEIYAQKRRPRLSEVHVGQTGDVTLYTAEKGTQLRLGRGGASAKLARYDALRAALGDDADELEVVHLDASVGPAERNRVVAKFFSGHAPQLFASADVEEGAETATHHGSGHDRGGRLPSYD